MPSLNLSDAFTESTFLDRIVVTRRRNVVSDKGRTTVVASTFVTYANVDAASPDQLDRLADEQHQGKTLSIVTKFRLRGVSTADGAEYQPDIIAYNGDDYMVQTIDDYSRYGAGWVQAVATSTVFQDQPPQNYTAGRLSFDLPSNSGYTGCF